MNSVIYYFSGTGNSLATAKSLCTYIPQMQIQPVTELLHYKVIPEQYDLVGFIMPAYYGHISPLAADCLSNLQFSSHQRVFSIISCAGSRGHATEDIRKLLAVSGKEVQYESMLIYPDNGILSHGAYPHLLQMLLLSLAKGKIKGIARQLKKMNTHKQLPKSLLYNNKTEISSAQSISEFSRRGLAFTVDSNCTHCHSCISVCPAKNISTENDKITFGANCQQCMACIQWCPQKAIDYKGLVKDRRRYHHPDISLADMTHHNAVKETTI